MCGALLFYSRPRSRCAYGLVAGALPVGWLRASQPQYGGMVNCWDRNVCSGLGFSVYWPCVRRAKTGFCRRHYWIGYWAIIRGCGSAFFNGFAQASVPASGDPSGGNVTENATRQDKSLSDGKNLLFLIFLKDLLLILARSV